MVWLRAKEVVAARRPDLERRIQKFTEAYGRPPGLAVVLVGKDPASEVYVGGKLKACEKMGLHHQAIRISETASAQELSNTLQGLNADSGVDSYLVQLPLPSHLVASELVHQIDPAKDADGLTPLNLGRMMAGQSLVNPCTPQGVLNLLEHYRIPVRGQKAVVIGRSQIVGLPMAHLLLQNNATVSVVHSQTPSVQEFTREADLVVVAAGKPRLFGRQDFKAGAVVVDVGIHRLPSAAGGSTLCGDVRSEELQGHVAALTPVPGGVGPMTIHTLLENAVTLAERRQERVHE